MKRVLLFLGVPTVIVSLALAAQFRTVAQSKQCNKAYPDVCIPSPPPDLDCKDVSYRNFKVLPADPHKFDRDKDGIGCESKR